MTPPRVAVFVLAVLLAAPASMACAQAWVAEDGDGTVTIAFQETEHTGHIQTGGRVAVDPAGQPAGLSRTAAMYLEIDYALTSRVSLVVGVPYVFAKYLGPRPPEGGSEPPMVRDVDRCYCWQSEWQDVGGTVRFNLLNGATALTPSVSVGVPSHAYEFAGEAVVGRRLNEVRVAVDVGRRLDTVTPRLAVQGHYGYAFVERVLDVPNNRSNASLDLLFEVTDRVSLRASAYRQVTHGGLRLGDAGPTLPDGYPWGEATTRELFDQHDRLLRNNYWHVGAGITFQLARANVFVSYVEFVGGTDTHDGRSITAGLAVPFSTRVKGRRS